MRNRSSRPSGAGQVSNGAQNRHITDLRCTIMQSREHTCAVHQPTGLSRHPRYSQAITHKGAPGIWKEGLLEGHSGAQHRKGETPSMESGDKIVHVSISWWPSANYRRTNKAKRYFDSVALQTAGLYSNGKREGGQFAANEPLEPP